MSAFCVGTKGTLPDRGRNGVDVGHCFWEWRHFLSSSYLVRVTKLVELSPVF